jgi:hypothetical protein
MELSYIYNNLATAHVKSSNYQAAVKYFDKSLAIKMLSFGRTHVSIANTT